MFLPGPSLRRRDVRQVPAAEHVIRYAVDLVRRTRPAGSAGKHVKDHVSWGAGPRASQALILAGKARAALAGRPAASVEDVRALAEPVLRHRVLTNFHAEAEGVDSRKVIEELLKALGAAATAHVPAFFRCSAVLVLPHGRVFEGEGVLAGSIADKPRGTGGFGFDPIFQLPDGRRLAELSLEEKNLLSHRARALNALEVHGAFDALLATPEVR